MIHLKEFLEAIQYRITEGSDYTWTCFGDNAHQLDSWNGSHEGYTACVIFDKGTQQVYSMELWDYSKERFYRWTEPEYIDALKQSYKQVGSDYKVACDSGDYIDLEVPEDILDKITCIVKGQEYDDRIKVPVDFTDEELLRYFKAAHERDMTFNQFVELALQEAINEYNLDPEAYKRKAESFKR